MTFGIPIFPGAHGDKELIRVLKEVFNQKVNVLSYRDTNLGGLDAILIPGGFPCRGSSTSNCFSTSPIMNSILEFAEKGKILVGIGNGFRVLCETELIPGSLRMNKSQRFICRNVFVKPDNDYSALTAELKNDRFYRIPIATGYGRYTARDDVLIRMRHQGQILFRYCDQAGRITEEVNYTGSVDNIAGVCNQKKNVFGLIPQPERAALKVTGNTDGQAIFRSLISYLM